MTTRRSLLKGAFYSAIASAGVFSPLTILIRAMPAEAQKGLETTKLTIAGLPTACFAPKYVARQGLFAAEGFTEVDIRMFPSAAEEKESIATGKTDLGMMAAVSVVQAIDAGASLVVLAGIHVGCFEVVGRKEIRSVKDLKGKTVAIPAFGSSQHLILMTMAAINGLDPKKDINFMVYPMAEQIDLLAKGKIDAFLGWPPQPQAAKAQKVGHIVISTTTDKPYSDNFCCMLVGNQTFVQRNPEATRRALRAILKGANMCGLDPEGSAKYLIDQNYAKGLEFTTAAMKSIPWGVWNKLDPEATLRFYAVRMHEAGVIKMAPDRIIQRGADWRFLNELKKELKG